MPSWRARFSPGVEVPLHRELRQRVLACRATEALLNFYELLVRYHWADQRPAAQVLLNQGYWPVSTHSMCVHDELLGIRQRDVSCLRLGLHGYVVIGLRLPLLGIELGLALGPLLLTFVLEYLLRFCQRAPPGADYIWLGASAADAPPAPARRQVVDLT